MVASRRSVLMSPPYISIALAMALGVKKPISIPMSFATAKSRRDMGPGSSTTTLTFPAAQRGERAARISRSD